MTKPLKSLAPFLFVIFLCFLLWKGLNLNPTAIFPKETFVAELESLNPDQYQFKNPNQEILFNDLVHELRCLVCQNQNLAESQADAAVKIRNVIYQQILASKTKQEILDSLVNRYGEFILYKPAFHSKTLILWLGPLLILFFALIIIYRIFFRRNAL